MTAEADEYREFYVRDESPMYVQQWGPKSNSGRTCVLVHGGAHTGVFWTSTPDGTPGWARYLTTRGWSVFVLDWCNVGRSPRQDNFLTSGPMPIVLGIAELLKQVGPALLIGHSIGAALAIKAMDLVPEKVSHFVALNPAPPAIIDAGRAALPEDRPIRFSEAEVRALFTNAERFPKEAVGAYRCSLCDLSPSIMNSLSAHRETSPLKISDLTRMASIPKIVIAGDADQLTPEPVCASVAMFLHCDFKMVGRDWDFRGFGHMIPIETGSEVVLFRLLAALKLD